jgi:hypothetical protein
MRQADPIPARYRRQEIRDDVSQTLHKALSGTNGVMSPSEWTRVVDEWIEHGVEQERTEEERAELTRLAERESRRADRAFTRKETIRKNGRTYVIVAVAALVVLSIPFTIFRNALAPRSTEGMSPEEVITAFYTSINTLDHETMDDAVVDGAGKERIRQVISLYVIERQRQGAELETVIANLGQASDPTGLVNAQAWVDAGAPTLATGQYPFGVTGLTMEEQPAPEGERRFLVHYQEWSPDFSDETGNTGVSGIVAFQKTDDLSMRQSRGDWVIYKMNEVDSTPIDVAAFRASLQ